MKNKARLLLVLFVLSAVLAGCQCVQENLHSDTELQLPVTLSDVERAQDVLKRVAFHTPLVEEEALSRICDARVFLKLESLQHTGSFKVRGAFNKIAGLSDAERAKGVITASAGNHAQGVALAASAYNIPAIIVMPEGVPKTKLQATKAYGAQVVLYGEVFDESLAKALEIQQETGAIFVHPFDDPMTIAGQGTIGLEILDDLPDADVILVPVGGGGLISGITVAVKGIRPSTLIIGVEPENAPSMAEALKRDRPTTVQVIPTIAEGTAVSKVGNITHAIVRKLVDKLITVSEEEIAEAMLLLLLKDKVLTEGAGALGAAALLSGKLDVKGKKVVIVISGGNIDSEELKELLTKTR
ncbi:MAG: threonine ammonia-lyase [Deltaproteobacteria bacterium]|nr:threonine ammonia-lyase [Deltaproteobacteria bacterium]